MIFTKQNLIFISMTVFIICHQTTATGEDEDANTSKDYTYNHGKDTILTSLDLIQWHVARLGLKHFYLGVFFKASWYKAHQFCNFHGMRLASIDSKAEHELVIKQFNDFGYDKEETHFWISGNDLDKSADFFWGTGVKFRAEDVDKWGAGEPSNLAGEDCVEYVNKSGGTNFSWNDQKCDFKGFIVCEVVKVVHDLK